MKIIKRIVFAIVLTIISFACCSSLYAAESEKDNLVVNLSTDKQEYTNGEKINVDLSIKNNNDYSVTLSSVKNNIPDGFSLVKDTSNELANQNIEIGETLHLKTELSRQDVEIIGTNKVDTGDNTQVKELVAVLGFAALALTLLIALKSRSMKKSLLILLSFGMLIGSSICNVEAKEEQHDLNVEETVLYDGNKVKLTSVLSYMYESKDPKNPIEYQDGIEETYLEYELNEERNKIVIFDSKDISEWKIGEIHVLKNKSNSSDDIAILIEDIESSDNGQLTIKYSQPDMAKVIKSIDYSGVEAQQGIVIPAEGVTFSEVSDKATKGRSAIPSVFSSRLGGDGSFNLFKKYNFSVDQEGAKLYGELCIEKINYDFKLHSNFLSINLDKAYITLESSVKLGMEAKSDFGGEKKVKIASFESYIGYGFIAVGDIFCYISANGELKIEYTINATCGFNYENEKFKGIWELEGKLSEAKANVNLKIGSIAEPKITFLKMGLIGGEFDFGRNYELKLDEVSLDPIEYCLDAGYYNYANVSSVLLPGTWNKKFTVNLYGKADSPIKEMLHFEEDKIVDECTRKFGSLEGKVLKHDGENLEPLYLADVTLEKDGKVLHSIKSSSNGLFTFDKVIEKGIYDIVVKSNHYQTYKGEIKIIGNKKNEVKSIVLEPVKKSITVTGKVFDLKSKQPIQYATVSVKGMEDRVTKADSEGNYSLEVPKGKQDLIFNAENYKDYIYTNEFSTNLEGIDIGLSRGYEHEVVTIEAGQSYQFDFTKEKRIFVRAEEPTEYSSYENGDVTYHELRDTGDEYYRGVEAGSHWEIKVFSGSLTVYGGSDSFYEGPDSNMSDLCTYTSMNGVDPMIDHLIKAGESKTFDYKVDGNKNSSVVIHCLSYDTVLGTEEVTDYYWNTHLGWELTVDIYELNKKQSFWRPLKNLEKDKIAITSGEVIVFYYRLDKVSVY